jgi:DNA-binding NtrC family response regulator
MAFDGAPPYVSAMEDPMNASLGDTEVTSLEDDFEILTAAQTDACVLFTGKVDAANLAQRIHSLSGWRFGRFKAVDCGWPEPELERQLFDVLHAEAIAAPDREPLPRLQQAGTIFLHEVGKLSPRLQARLSEALAGPSTGRSLRVRVMASSSEPLLQRVAAGTFNDRLFYRLNVIHLARRDA